MKALLTQRHLDGIARTYEAKMKGAFANWNDVEVLSDMFRANRFLCAAATASMRDILLTRAICDEGGRRHFPGYLVEVIVRARFLGSVGPRLAKLGVDLGSLSSAEDCPKCGDSGAE